MNIATVFLLTASMSTLVLRSGDRIAVEGPVHEANGVVIFRVSGGALYSMPESEIDPDATRAANEVADLQSQPAAKPLKVSAAERDRLLRELEQNHSGVAAPPPRYDSESLREPSPGETAAQSAEEWRWRREARSYEEGVRQSKENLDLLLATAERLRAHIRGLISLGWKPQSFTYESTQLAYTEAQIPGAELEVQRAQRAYDQFRDDARRQGVLPGWLR